MAEIRQIGGLTIHFLGDNAAQLKNSFDGSFAGSKSFRSAMSETARTYRNIYVGGSLEDLKDQPGFESAEFDPNSEAAQNTSAFGKGAGPETYFIVVTGKKHNLAQDTDFGTRSASAEAIFSWPSIYCRRSIGKCVRYAEP